MKARKYKDAYFGARLGDRSKVDQVGPGHKNTSITVRESLVLLDADEKLLASVADGGSTRRVGDKS